MDNSSDEEMEIHLHASDLEDDEDFSDEMNESNGSMEINTTDDESNQDISGNQQIPFNPTLPAQHTYLGNDFEELNGKVFLEECKSVTIPILCLPGIVLVPGQLLPFKFQGDYFLTTVRNIIEGSKIFGLVSNFDKNLKFNDINLNFLGTIVEIRSYEQKNSIVKIKAEGRQRFLVQKTWTDPDTRTMMGKVIILPEVELTNLLYKDIGLSSRGCTYNDKLLSACTPFPKFVYEQYDPEVLMDKIKSHLNRWASFTKTGKKNSESESSNIIEDRVVKETIGTNQPFTNTNNSSNNTTSQQTSSTQSNTNNPSETQAVSLNTTRTVVTRIIPVNDSEESEEDTEKNQEEHGFKAYAPANPLEFSYWVTANLPLQDYQRLQLLSLNSPIQRLRWQASFFEKYLSLSCRNCNSKICNCEDIFCMSVNGPQNSFVNPSGIIHEILTVHKVKNVYLFGRKQQKFSWFPGYSWIICNCNCGTHLGWKFVTNNKNLSPEYFYGLTRSNIKPAIELEKDDTNWKPVI